MIAWKTDKIRMHTKNMHAYVTILLNFEKIHASRRSLEIIRNNLEEILSLLD
jgi:hypothetical protein